MKTMKSSVRAMMLAVVAMLLPAVASAQAAWTQQNSCPGWNNPNMFTGWTTQVYGAGGYSGSGGVKNSSSSSACPNVMTGATGTQSLGPAYTAAQMNSTTASGCGYPSLAIPDQFKQFAIMTDVNGVDPNTANHLKYVPTQFNTFDTGGVVNTNLTKSIRIGDGAADCTPNSYDVSLLNYDMKVTSNNAMLYLYYAIVAQAPSHNHSGNPAFIIRVMKKNSSGTWDQVSDTMAYYISSTSTTISQSGSTCPNMTSITPESNFNVNGWHQVSISGVSSGSTVIYKDWSKVAINLANYLYDTVRVQALIYDCSAEFHFAYAYIAGECRPMELKATGCPAGAATNVSTISAPRGLLNYEWGVSRFGYTPNPNIDFGPSGDSRHFSFRTVASGTEANGFNNYNVSASDFQVFYRTRTPDGHDSIQVRDSVGNMQTFRCKMTSAIDPAKPFTSNLYVNVQNTKPSMSVDSLLMCDTTVLLHNHSYVPGDPSLVVDSATEWRFYSNPAGNGTPDTIIVGDSVLYKFSSVGNKSVTVRTYTTDPECWSEATYRIRMLTKPKAGMTLSSRQLCDADQTTITDTTSTTVRRQWKFLSENWQPGDPDTLYDIVTGYYGDNQSITRPFTHSVEPIMLTVRNGKYFLNPYNQSDTNWCEDRAYDTVVVFVHPDLRVEGDTIVCIGSTTDATVTPFIDGVRVDSCTFQWSLSCCDQITGGIPTGAHLAVSPYADTSVYYVKVTTTKGCVAWDSVHAYLVRPQLAMYPTDGRICPGDTVMLVGSAADHYTWTASPADASLVGQDSANTIYVSPSKTTTYTMVGHGTNDCDASPLTKTVTIVPLPVPRISVSPEFVDSDDPTVTLRDVSPNGVRSEWEFYGNERVDTREVVHTFGEAEGRDSVYTVLTSYNVMDCPSTKTFGIPVMMFTAWMPNIFTPGTEDENATFRLFSINQYEVFHIYIYNRNGQLVFESVDPKFEWDGTRNGGDKCPQGTYVYVCNYRKTGTPTLITKSGTITLIR